MSSEPDILEGELCPVCGTKNLTLMERALEIPHFGLTHVFGMNCSNCDYGMQDVEFEDSQKAVKVELEIKSEDDLKKIVVKSAAATIKIPRMVTISPGPVSDGFITTVEGVLNRFKEVLEEMKQDDDKKVAKKAKNQFKKLQKVLWGQESIKLQITDPTGNSAIIEEPFEFD